MKFVILILILLIGLTIGRMAGKIIKKLLKQSGLHEIRTKSGFKLSVGELIGNLTSYVIYFMTFIVFLSELGISQAILSIILICVVSLVIVMFVLGVKDFTPNFAAGIYLFMKNRIQSGSVVHIGKRKGTVLDISLLEVKLKTPKNEVIYIPNSKILSDDLIIENPKKK